MRNVLYLHGLGKRTFIENETSGKVRVLKEFFQNLQYPIIDYKPDDVNNIKKIFYNLKEKIINEKIDLIIGNSFGGYLAFWLGFEIDSVLETISFNPPIGRFLDFNIPNKKNNQSYIVISNKDEIVKPNETLDYIQENFNDYIKNTIKFHFIDDSHQINSVNFRNSISFILSKHSSNIYKD